jgi:hypothetical protein
LQAELKTEIWVQNAFSGKLAPLGFNLYDMLVIDLMHEFELGVWKALFIHLLWILEAVDKSKVNELDCRCVFPCHKSHKKPNRAFALVLDRCLLLARAPSGAFQLTFPK